jgi:hypothetical protein
MSEKRLRAAARAAYDTYFGEKKEVLVTRFSRVFALQDEIRQRLARFNVRIEDVADFRAVERMFNISPCPFCSSKREMAWDAWGTHEHDRMLSPNSFILFECMDCGVVRAKHWVKGGFVG